MRLFERRTLKTAVAALGVLVLCAASVSGAPALVGPASVNVSERFDVEVEDLSFDLDEFLGPGQSPQADWHAFGAENVGDVDVTPHLDLRTIIANGPKRQIRTLDAGKIKTIEVSEAGDQKTVVVPYVTVTCHKKCRLTVVFLYVEDGRAKLLSITLEVDGDAPDPDPGAKQVAFFFESEDKVHLPLAQQEILSGLKCRKRVEQAGHHIIGFFDFSAVVNSRNGRNSEPELSAWWAAVSGAQLPLVAVAPLGGGQIKHYPLPADADALLKLLGDAKKK